jgi:ATP-binding cassette subfamily B protein
VDRNIQLIGSWSLFFPALSTLIGFTVVILVAVGGLQVVNQDVSLGTFSAFYQFLTQLVFPMIAIGFVTNIFQRGAASMGRMNYILTAEPRIADDFSSAEDRAPRNGSGTIQRQSDSRSKDYADVEISGDIEFRHLNFAYPSATDGVPGPLVLKDINIRVPAGTTLAVIGPTGSGKSTFAALIGRLWDVPRGELLIGGRSVRDYRLDTLRRAIGYVPQDTFLFSETIRENIAFGVDQADEERILEAAEIANIAGDIQGFPSRYETMVGERGITLSGGQKQRTALARAILRQPDILILDDALASVDTHTEEQILGHLREVMRQRTTILIAHRISTVKNADQIAVLREGEIIERGTHDELLALSGYYADLHRKQLLEEELERE